MSDGLESFDGFTRKAAADGMFNDDQVSWMRYLSSLPREAKCRCGWDRKWECVGCNYAGFDRLGIAKAETSGDFDGNAGSTWDGKAWRQHGYHTPLKWRLPNGCMTGYAGAVEWLQRQEGR